MYSKPEYNKSTNVKPEVKVQSKVKKTSAATKSSSTATSGIKSSGASKQTAVSGKPGFFSPVVDTVKLHVTIQHNFST